MVVPVLIKKAKEESLIEIENARQKLDSEMYLKISDLSIEEINKGDSELTKKIKELVGQIKGKI